MKSGSARNDSIQVPDREHRRTAAGPAEPRKIQLFPGRKTLGENPIRLTSERKWPMVLHLSFSLNV